MTALAPKTPLPPENAYGHTKKLSFIIERIQRHAGQKGRPIRLLDFGCGNGTAVSRYLIELGQDYTGVDFHPPSLGHARAHFAAPNARFLDSVPEQAEFDVIVYSDVLEHLPKPDQVLAAHMRQLAPDGIFLGSIPNGYGAFEIERFLDRKLRISQGLRKLLNTARRLRGQTESQGAALPYNHESGHVVFFTRKKLDQVLAAAGLELSHFRKGSLLGADLSASFLIRGPLVGLNIRAADHLPAWMVSTWHFEARKRA